MAEQTLTVGRRRFDRIAALRLLMDVLVTAADEAPCRDSEGWLRQAAADAGNAINVERWRAMQ
jgi:hypothetical protein